MCSVRLSKSWESATPKLPGSERQAFSRKDPYVVLPAGEWGSMGWATCLFSSSLNLCNNRWCLLLQRLRQSLWRTYGWRLAHSSFTVAVMTTLIYSIFSPSTWYFWTSLVVQMVKSLPAMQETWVPCLGLEDSLEKGMATPSSTLAWKIPGTRSLVGSQSIGLQGVRRDWVTNTHTHTHTQSLYYPETFQTICLLRCKRRGLKYTTTQHIRVSATSQAVAWKHLGSR